MNALIMKNVNAKDMAKDKQIKLVISHKDKITKLTGKLLGVIEDAQETYQFNKKQSLLIKQLLHQSVSELSTIASFCSTREQDRVNRIIDSLARLSVNLHWELAPLLEYFCTVINGITLDFNKTPFRFGRGFNERLGELETRFRSIFERL